jgi:hypothetical protein
MRELVADALVRRDAGLAARQGALLGGLRRGDHRLDPYNTFDLLWT